MVNILDTYKITILGTSQGVNFQQSGILKITSTVTTVGTNNGVNPIDVFIESGNPFAFPMSGSIWLSTNSALIPGANSAQIDLAYVSLSSSNNQITIKPDPNLAAVTVNGFNAYSGIFAEVYQIFDGTISLNLQNKKITGTIDVLGTGAIFHSNTPYRATITGTLSSGSGTITGGGTGGGTGNTLNTPIRRFQNTSVPGTYLFAGEQEASGIRQNFKNFKEEGVAFQVATNQTDPLLQPLYIGHKLRFSKICQG